jgi:hypothetical protein
MERKSMILQMKAAPDIHQNAQANSEHSSPPLRAQELELFRRSLFWLITAGGPHRR